MTRPDIAIRIATNIFEGFYFHILILLVIFYSVNILVIIKLIMAIKINSQRILKLCNRCGNPAKETHHKKPRSEGGSDNKNNLTPLCIACHDYVHTKRNILRQLTRLKRKRTRKNLTKKQLKAWKTRNTKRIRLWEHRLAVLELLNTEEIIKSTGKYTSYWVDETTH